MTKNIYHSLDNREYYSVTAPASTYGLTGSLLDRLQAHRSTSLQGESLTP